LIAACDNRRMPAALPLRHFLLALAVVAVWGSNFVVIKFALGQLPPLLMAALRFGLVLLPGLFFVARPAVRLGNLALYGFLIGGCQFGLLYVAMNGHISPGLASLVIQVQVFFTIGLAMRLAGERVRVFQWFALLLAAGGIGVIILHTDGSTTPLGLVLVLLAALAWAGGNIAAKQGAPSNMLAYVVWSSAFALPPLIALSLIFEGWAAISAALRTADAAAWAAVAWQAWGNSLFGYAAWGWLLARHPAATITPMALLVPVFGMGAATLMLDESLPAWKLAAAALVMAGLALNLLWPRLRAALAAGG
jgi:O-acetylserine/cysteine efflux transporter